MVVIDITVWGDWEALIQHVRNLMNSKIYVKLINCNALFELWHGEELEEMGLTRVVMQ